MIDINVHPQKKEVRFTEEEILLNVLKTLIQQTLEKANLLFSFNTAESLTLNDSKMDDGTAQLLRDATKLWNVKKHFEDEPILQINNLYLAVTTRQGFLLIDQHAAHERILYEQFLGTFLAQKLSQQRTQQQQEVSLPLLEAELLEENKNIFEGVGFVFTRNSPQSFTFFAVPTLLQTRKLETYLLEVLRDIIDQVEVTELDLESHRTIAYLACRNAIKAGEVLTQAERKNLIDELFKTTSKYTCPHGRPVMIEITHKDLEKMFYRIPAFRNEK
jgi:DNA mismatch repair protein MutL